MIDLSIGGVAWFKDRLALRDAVIASLCNVEGGANKPKAGFQIALDILEEEFSKREDNPLERESHHVLHARLTRTIRHWVMEGHIVERPVRSHNVKLFCLPDESEGTVDTAKKPAVTANATKASQEPPPKEKGPSKAQSKGAATNHIIALARNAKCTGSDREAFTAGMKRLRESVPEEILRPYAKEVPKSRGQSYPIAEITNQSNCSEECAQELLARFEYFRDTISLRINYGVPSIKRKPAKQYTADLKRECYIALDGNFLGVALLCKDGLYLVEAYIANEDELQTLKCNIQHIEQIFRLHGKALPAHTTCEQSS